MAMKLVLVSVVRCICERKGKEQNKVVRPAEKNRRKKRREEGEGNQIMTLPAARTLLDDDADDADVDEIPGPLYFSRDGRIRQRPRERARVT